MEIYFLSAVGIDCDRVDPNIVSLFYSQEIVAYLQPDRNVNNRRLE